MALSYGASSSFSVSMEGPFGNTGSKMKIAYISLTAADWKGAVSPYSQVVEVEGVSANSMVDLQPSVDQLEAFRDKELAFTTENDGGTVTVYAIGDKPTEDYTIQATITEVVA